MEEEGRKEDRHVTQISQASNPVHLFRVSQFATADEYTDTTLRVLSIEKRQFGNYSCTATNKLGQSSAIVTLIETTTPVCPPACGTLTYSAAYTPTPSVLTLLALFAAILLRN
ncbi:Lachesin [Portunus trituberculatus]|uniref:Lachesin n=1 Tax=Portunus trituberculatus TaxID=210409 RepID=A0A5B7EIE1_PORTR|nr:Lachesin [Portunus trituberculatus]